MRAYPCLRWVPGAPPAPACTRGRCGIKGAGRKAVLVFSLYLLCLGIAAL